MAAFKLGNMTLGSLFKKPETVLYPVEKKPQPVGLKGQIGIDVANCILCGMCERSCSTDCIAVDKAQGTWAIDRFACVQCGYCVTVCPKKCLHMLPDYAAASTQRAVDHVTVPKQERAKPAKKESPAKEPAGSVARQVDHAPAKSPDAPPADPVLEAKIALLDEGKARKVRAALEATS